VAVDKARTAAIFVRPSREMEEQVTRGRLGALALHGARALTGGVPLRVDGEVVGAIGTSGETPDEDEQISLAGAAAEFSYVEVPALTYEEARDAAEAAGAVAAARGVAPVIAVVDAGGELMYLLRPDSAQVASVNVARDKERTAAIYRRPSKDFEDQASSGRPSALHLARAVPAQGGMPIVRDGEVVGAIGVSGASSADEDQELATIGANGSAGSPDGRANGAQHSSAEAVRDRFRQGGLLLDARGYKVDAGRRVEPGEVEYHEHVVDVMHVVEGTATVVTARDDRLPRGQRRRAARPRRGGRHRARAGRGRRAGDPARHSPPVRGRVQPVPLLRREGRGVMATEAPTRVVSAARLPGPPELLPGRPDAIVDLQSEEGVALVQGRWRYAGARVEAVDFVEVGSASDPLGPGDVPNCTWDVVPHAEGADYDDSGWRTLAPADTMLRLGEGRESFNWYRIAVTIPERVGDLDPTGATIVFEIVVDDYAEVWVNGQLPRVPGMTGGQVVGGFNAPNRVVLTRDARPGQRFQLAVMGMNGPISASPPNYVWVRTATLDLYAAGRASAAEPAELRVERDGSGLDAVLPADVALERVAGGFEFTEGPVWSPDGGLLFSSPNTNAIYRLDPEMGTVTVFRSKSGYAGVDVGRYHQPGSNGLAFDPDGRLTICQHGNRRLVRVNPHGDVTVLADRFEGGRLNSPNDLAYRSDGTLFFTDPPFGLPEAFDDPARELPFSGVFGLRDGDLTLLDGGLAGPNGIALSPDERHLYVGNWDPAHKVVTRYELDSAGHAVGRGEVFHDMTDAPGEDAIDGLEVDREGNLYACGPGGIWVLSPEGERLGLLELPEAPHNLAWGDEDRRTLYVTALTSVYRMRLRIPGAKP
jgi:gluconolactonase